MAFTGKVVIITGASSGIGAGCAASFAKDGAKVVLGGRNEDRLKETVKCCQEAGAKAENILIVIGDVTKEDDCNNLVDKAVEAFGGVDALINNAGSVTNGTLEQLTVQDMDHMYNTLLRSVFMVTKRAMPHLKKTKGSVVNVSTVGAVIPATSLLAYGSAKAGLNHFTSILAQEVGPHGVRVNAIMPGAINTPLLSSLALGSTMTPQEGQSMLANFHALRRCGEVREVVQLIKFLSSSECSSFITGALIPVDGGAIGRSVMGDIKLAER